MARAADDFGGIDILVNNAGIQHVSAVRPLCPGHAAPLRLCHAPQHDVVRIVAAVVLPSVTA